LLLIKLEESPQVFEAKRAVLFGRAEQEGQQGSLFEGELQGLLEGSILELGHACDRIDAEDVLERRAPVGLVECARCEHYVVF